MTDWRVRRVPGRYPAITVERNDLWLDWCAETPDGSDGWYRIELPERGLALVLDREEWARLRDGMARLDAERGPTL